MLHHLPFASRPPSGIRTDEENSVPIAGYTHTYRLLDLLCQSDKSDYRGREYGTCGTLVVERDITTRNGCVKGTASFTHSCDGFTESPVHLRLVRVSEIKTVGHTQRFRTGAGYITCRFSNSHCCALARIQVGKTAITVCRHPQSLLCPGDAYHGCITTSRQHLGVAANHAVVLTKDMLFTGNIRTPQQLESSRTIVLRLFECRHGFNSFQVGRQLNFAFVYWCTATEGEVDCGNVGDKQPILHDLHPSIFGHIPDFNSLQFPLLCDIKDFLFTTLFSDEKHAFLGFAQQGLVRRHPLLTARNLIQIEDDPHACLRCHLA